VLVGSGTFTGGHFDREQASLAVDGAFAALP